MTDVSLHIDRVAEERLRRAHYRIYGHSAVEICHWTKQALKDKGVCYKEKFYGIDSHRCMEFSPSAIICENRCIYCWRMIDFYKTQRMPDRSVLSPVEIVKTLLIERRKLLAGFLGDKSLDKQKIIESFTPTHYAISLSGEPTLYPKLPSLIKYLKGLPETKSVFLVTNGQEPSMIRRLIVENALPTQLYLSMSATSKEDYLKINRPLYKDAWDRFLESLSLIKDVATRTVIRYTLIKGINDQEYKIKIAAELIKAANPNFVEIKSYMHIGASMSNLGAEHMLEPIEIDVFSNRLLKLLPLFLFIDKSVISRIDLLQNQKNYIDRWIVKPSGHSNKR
ncbi:MAG: 4-demethylwyosine synthase TYW1 [Nitrososphaerota archaeon]|jgi:tRNA wybutosine-synthesizing protein 1|nr:4-demethylwyosine synthase TYW1 [Nitrososphaerota archaeon]